MNLIVKAQNEIWEMAIKINIGKGSDTAFDAYGVMRLW